MEINRVCAHYGQTCLSSHDALASSVHTRQPNYSLEDVAGDCLHPAHGQLGHDHVTNVLVAIRAFSRACPSPLTHARRRMTQVKVRRSSGWAGSKRTSTRCHRAHASGLGDCRRQCTHRMRSRAQAVIVRRAVG
jgi:hypothetical protein